MVRLRRRKVGDKVDYRLIDFKRNKDGVEAAINKTSSMIQTAEHRSCTLH